MADKKRQNRIWDWALGDILSRIVGLLLPWLSAMVGGFAGVQEYVASGNLTAALVVGAIVFGFAALGANHLRQFLVKSTVKGKLVQAGAGIAKGKDTTTGQEGYAVLLTLVNTSDGPLEYEVLKEEVHANNVRVTPGPQPVTTAIVASGFQGQHSSALFPGGVQTNAIIIVEIVFEYRYGRPGKMRHRERVKLRVNTETDEAGNVKGISATKIT